MNRPTFQEKTEVKVISHDFTAFYNMNGKDQDYDMYGWRGKVTEIIGFDDNRNEIAKPYTPENYPTQWWVYVEFISPVDGNSYNVTFDNWPDQLATVQKKFIDIENLREFDEVIGQKEDGTDIIRKSNAGAFDVGDIIQITTKIDGANASISWDETTQKLEIFSRTNLLDTSNSLKGFYDYIKTQVEPKTDWSIYSDFVFFGEWCIKHTIKYNNDWYGKWRVYDIWCKSTNTYVSQERVKATCKQLGLEYIEELYNGPFISWEHCRSFMNKSTAYGPDQEGIVVKNQSKFFKPEIRFPAYLKIVNESFKETMKVKPPKEIDPEVEAARKRAIELANSIVTEARVKKMILKLIDEGLIPENLTPKDMGLIMKNLPKRIYDDVLKEEMETVIAIGENASKIISTCVAQVARKIVIG
jgi:hypothetical protein